MKKLQILFIVAIATLLASNIAVAQTELTYKNGVFQSGKELKPKWQTIAMRCVNIILAERFQ